MGFLQSIRGTRMQKIQKRKKNTQNFRRWQALFLREKELISFLVEQQDEEESTRNGDTKKQVKLLANI